MKRTPRYLTMPCRLLPLLLLAAFVCAGCEDSFLFEKTVVDPHPPVLENFTYEPTVITTGDTVRGSFTYFDEGSDIEILEMLPLEASPLIFGDETTKPFEGTEKKCR